MTMPSPCISSCGALHTWTMHPFSTLLPLASEHFSSSSLSFLLGCLPGPLLPHRASLVAQMVKNLPAMQETKVRCLGQEDPLEKGMAVHSRVLAWRIPWTEEPGGLQCMGSQRVGRD